MKSHSIAKKDELTTQILVLRNKIKLAEESQTVDNEITELTILTNQIAPITKLHSNIQNSSESLLKDLRNKINQLITNEYDQTNKDSLNALKKSLATIATGDISRLTPANTPAKTQWHYRYALALALLDDYSLFLRETIPSLQAQFLKTVASHMNTISSQDVVDLLPSSPENKDIFNEAIEKKIFTRHYLAHKEAIIEAEKKRIEQAQKLAKINAAREKELKERSEKDAKELAPVKNAYEEELKQFKKEIALLNSDAARQSLGLITETCEYSNQFIEALERDINVNITYQNATEALNEARGMMKNLKASIEPYVTVEARNQYQAKATEHANKLLALVDKRKDKQSNFWGWVLLIAGITLFTFGVLALVAATHGVFLGVAFTATVAVKTAAGATLTAFTAAGKGAAIGGALAVPFGFVSAIGGLCIFGCKKPNEVKNKAVNIVNAAKKALTEEKQLEVQSISLKTM